MYLHVHEPEFRLPGLSLYQRLHNVLEDDKLNARTFIALSIGVIAVATVVGSATPSPAQSQPISSSVVSATCLDPNDDMTLQAYAYVNGYLMCVTVDANTQGVAAYQETAPGSGQFN